MTELNTTFSKIQQEEVSYRAPVSENLLTKIGGDINFLADVICPVGTVIASMLNEDNFNSKIGVGRWVLCDGRSIVGSELSTLLVAQSSLSSPDDSTSTIPDLRGRFIRGRNFSRSTSTGDTSGDLKTGNSVSDQVGPHSHAERIYSTPSGAGFTSPAKATNTLDTEVSGTSTEPNGGLETAPRYVVLNYFIRIN